MFQALIIIGYFALLFLGGEEGHTPEIGPPCMSNLKFSVKNASKHKLVTVSQIPHCSNAGERRIHTARSNFLNDFRPRELTWTHFFLSLSPLLTSLPCFLCTSWRACEVAGVYLLEGKIAAAGWGYQPRERK
jgi:hypothetical protein